jgi:hypothetical protein
MIGMGRLSGLYELELMVLKGVDTKCCWMSIIVW